MVAVVLASVLKVLGCIKQPQLKQYILTQNWRKIPT